MTIFKGLMAFCADISTCPWRQLFINWRRGRRSALSCGLLMTSNSQGPKGWIVNRSWDGSISLALPVNVTPLALSQKRA